MWQSLSKYLAVLALASGYAFFNDSLLARIILAAVAVFLVCLAIVEHQRSLKRLGNQIQTEKELGQVVVQQAHSHLYKLIQAIPSPLVYINQRGDFELQNRYFTNLVGESITNVYDSKLDHRIRQIMLDAFLNEQQFARQFHVGITDYQVLSIPLISTGRYNGCMLIFQDVTRILDGERMQKRFVADASHELKTPISAIKGMVEIITRDDFSDRATESEFIHQIAKETSRLEQIVSDLLLQSRLAANKVYLEKTHFNLRHFFEGLIYEKRQPLNHNQIKVVLDCSQDLVIYADQFRLSQVFSNLFDNSLNYAKNKNIHISCGHKNKKLVISFADNGEGIAAEHLPYIFDRFFRGSPDRNRDTGGSGLGLAIAKDIIEAHGGTIAVSSEAGEGTEFLITLTVS